MKSLAPIFFFLASAAVLCGQTTYTESPMAYVCGNYDAGGDGIRFRVWPTPIVGSNAVFRIRKAANNTCSGSANFGTSGTMRIRENSTTGPIVASCNLSSCGGSDYIDLSTTLTFTSGSKNYYATITAGGFDYWAGAITITASTPQNINITSPSGGSFNKGCNMNIQWTSTNVGNVSIELYRVSTNSVVAVIADGISNSGSYSYTVGTEQGGQYPGNIPGGTYRIKMYETGTGNALDYSNDFTINTPSLTVSSPNGGESYALGGNMPISWTSANFCGNVSLELVDASNNFVALIADNTANDGSHTWPVSGVATGNYKVKIYKTVPSGASPVLDYSNSTFSITNAPPSINITSPSGGSFNKGCNMNIQWTSVNVGNVSIELYRVSTNSVVAVIADGISNSGSYSYTVGTEQGGQYPGNIPGGTYRIKMYETGTGNALDYSNDFTINTPSLTVSSPNGGESFALGGNMPISWTSANFCGNVSLELVDASNNFVALIADNTANDGSHTWPVSGVATGSYKVKIYKTVPSGASPVLDYSNSTFSITNTAPSIDITSPSGGSFNKGCNMNIQWTSVNVGNVSIELVLASNNSVVAVIADPTANDGQFTWETGTNKDGIYPGNIPAGSYKIKMYETGTGAGVDYSNAFTITAPSMAFTFPNGGESFALGSSMAIAWNHSNFCGNISIELVNGSNTITVVADDIPNSGAFNWIVGGAAPGTNYRLKIYKTVALPPIPVVDFTDAVFEITSGSGGGDCTNITDLDPNDPNEVEAYNAASCLCQLGYVQPQPYGAGNSNGVNPAAEIYRADLAKLVYYAVYKGNLPNPDPSKFFPNPFVDLQSQFSGNPYYDFAKALSYLEFGDGVAPFDRDFLNFLPYGNIQKRYALKVLLEAFNIAPDNSNGGTIQNVSPGDDAYGYVHKAWDMQLITSPGGNATLPVTRQDVFIILHRLILNTGNGGCNTSYTAPTITASSYFHPGNFTTANLARAVGTGEGYFSHTPNGGFAIPGLNLPLVFAPSYNSYLSELPKAFRPLQPLGGGWTHPYNAYIIRIPAWSEGGYSVSAKTMVFWPSGEIHFYDDATQTPDTYGVFDEITTFGATTIRIKKKNQVEFTFTKYGTAPSDPYMLTLIEDRNGNSIQIVTETAQKTPRRIDRVIGTAGRILEFSYQSGTDFLSSVLDVAGSRIMFFSVNSAGNLAWYQNPKGIKEYYSYGANPGWHLLYEVTRPALNKINNDYDPASRKLLYSKVLENGVEKYRLDVAVSAHYATSNPYISSTLTDINSVTDNEFTTAGFLGTSTINNNGTNISYQNIYGGGDPSLPSQVKYGNLGNSGQTFDLDYLYDTKGNVTKITLPDGSYHQFTYNSQTNDLLTYRNPRNKITTYQYDANENLDKIIDPMGFITDYAVNSLGLVTQVKNPLNITVNFSYDAQGNRTSISAPLGITSTFSYDNIGRVTSSSNPNNQVTQYLYDAHGQVTKTTRVSSGGNVVTNYSYDANDNPTSVQNANGHSTTMTYDAGDFMKTTTFGNDTKTFTYHKDGLLNTYQKPDGTLLTHVYDDLGRLTNDGYASYVYDNKNNLTQVSKGGNTVSFTYDNLNRLTGSTDYYGKTVGYQYDNNGNVTQLTYPGNFTVAYTYDDNDRMTTASWNGLTTSYTYRNDGLLSKTTYPNGAYCDYFYDAAGRMSGLDNKKSDGTIISTYSFTSDPLGNHLSELVNEPLGIPNFPAQNITGAFNSENEPTAIGGTSFSFDANGNRTAKGSLTSTWDNRDLPLSIGSNNYEYDGTGLRRKAVRNGATTKYVWDVLGMGNVLAETDNAGNITAYYVYGMGLIAKVDASNQSFYYHYDFRGSTIAMTNSGQTVVNQYSYDPFGQVMNSAEAVANPFKYVGKWGVCSEGTGLYHMRARYYDAATGRFLSEDPVWNTNLYGYAENNPVNMVDMNGESAKSATNIPVLPNYGGQGTITQINLDISNGSNANKKINVGSIDYTACVLCFSPVSQKGKYMQASAGVEVGASTNSLTIIDKEKVINVGVVAVDLGVKVNFELSKSLGFSVGYILDPETGLPAGGSAKYGPISTTFYGGVNIEKTNQNIARKLGNNWYQNLENKAYNFFTTRGAF